MHGPHRSFPAPNDSPPALAQSDGGRRVLIVEDHPDTAESLRLLLQFHGHEVWVAPPDRTGWSWR